MFIFNRLPRSGRVIVGIVLIIIFGSGWASKSPEKNLIKVEPQPQVSVAEEQRKLYAVKKVIDGDTIHVDIDGVSSVIRIIGLDTPESVDPRKPVQCFANEASKKAKELLEGKRVGIESDSTQANKDKYNRLLRYIILEDGMNFSKLMISEGYAHEYTYQIPYKYQSEFRQAEREAREAKRGLWADEACLGR